MRIVNQIKSGLCAPHVFHLAGISSLNQLSSSTLWILEVREKSMVCSLSLKSHQRRLPPIAPMRHAIWMWRVIFSSIQTWRIFFLVSLVSFFLFLRRFRVSLSKSYEIYCTRQTGGITRMSIEQVSKEREKKRERSEVKNRRREQRILMGFIICALVV